MCLCGGLAAPQVCIHTGHLGSHIPLVRRVSGNAVPVHIGGLPRLSSGPAASLASFVQCQLFPFSFPIGFALLFMEKEREDEFHR
jgi:hypothetical protein